MEPASPGSPAHLSRHSLRRSLWPSAVSPGLRRLQSCAMSGDQAQIQPPLDNGCFRKGHRIPEITCSFDMCVCFLGRKARPHQILGNVQNTLPWCRLFPAGTRADSQARSFVNCAALNRDPQVWGQSSLDLGEGGRQDGGGAGYGLRWLVLCQLGQSMVPRNLVRHPCRHCCGPAF